jgi:hypothetical protein
MAMDGELEGGEVEWEDEEDDELCNEMGCEFGGGCGEGEDCGGGCREGEVCDGGCGEGEICDDVRGSCTGQTC